MKAGGEAIVELEKSLAAQRQAIVDKANQAVILINQGRSLNGVA
jgi:hypothetical protein